MLRFALVLSLIATTVFISCIGSGSNKLREVAIINGPLQVAPVEDTSLEGVSWEKQPGNLDFAFRAVPPEGRFLELHLPDGIFPGAQIWTGNEHTISHMFFRDGLMQIGVVPLLSYRGTRITVSIPIHFGYKKTLAPPIGDQNALIDLKIDSEGDGNVELSWTEVNSGDYDFNSEVNVFDITPIARLFTQPVTGGPDQTGFWVDGDRNNEINAADITPIALNFLNRVDGYNIRLEGNIEVSVPRADSIGRLGLPPQYSTMLPGSELDNFTVIPIDTGGTEGQDTVVVPPEPDTSFQVALNGVELYDLDGSGLSGPAGEGRIYSSIVEVDPLRRILPGVDPDSARIGTALGPRTPKPEFYDLPVEGQFALLLMFIPTIDLNTGDPRPFVLPPGQPIWDYEPNVLVVPFKPTGHIVPGKVNLTIDFAPGPFDSWIGNFASSGGTVPEGQFRLDYGDGFVIRDANGNGNFEDEAHMLDEPRWGVSPNRLDQLGQLVEYAASDNLGLSLTATVDGYDVTRGVMELSVVRITYDIGGPPLELADIVLRLSEFTSFASMPEGGGDQEPIEPGIIDPGANILVEGYQLVEISPELPDVFWGDHVVKIIF